MAKPHDEESINTAGGNEGHKPRASARVEVRPVGEAAPRLTVSTTTSTPVAGGYATAAAAAAAAAKDPPARKSPSPLETAGLGTSSGPPLSTIGNVYFFGYSHFEDFNGVDLLSFVKEHNTTLTFPQKLMLMLTHVDRENAAQGTTDTKSCVSWTPDGCAFVIRDRKAFVDRLLPLFFRQAKFPSFTRKLYRWGFRQICIPQCRDQKDRELYFGHEFFKRDDKSQMANMRSVTAAGTRRAIASLTANKKKRAEVAAATSASKQDKEKVKEEAVEVGVLKNLPGLESALDDMSQLKKDPDVGFRSSPTKSLPIETSSVLESKPRARTTNGIDSVPKRASIASSSSPTPGNLSILSGPPEGSAANAPPARPSDDALSAGRFLQNLASTDPKREGGSYQPAASQAPSQAATICPGANPMMPPPPPFVGHPFPTMGLPGLFGNNIWANPASALFLSHLSRTLNQNQLQSELAATALLMQMPQPSAQLQNLSNALAGAQSSNNTSQNTQNHDAVQMAVDMLMNMNNRQNP